MDVFDLKGSKYASGGTGGDDYRGKEFTLQQGIVVANITHHGEGQFRLSFAPSEEFQGTRNQEHRVIGTFARLPRVGRDNSMSRIFKRLSGPERNTSFL